MLNVPLMVTVPSAWADAAPRARAIASARRENHRASLDPVLGFLSRSATGSERFLIIFIRLCLFCLLVTGLSCATGPRHFPPPITPRGFKYFCGRDEAVEHILNLQG